MSEPPFPCALTYLEFYQVFTAREWMPLAFVCVLTVNFPSGDACPWNEGISAIVTAPDALIQPWQAVAGGVTMGLLVTQSLKFIRPPLATVRV